MAVAVIAAVALLAGCSGNVDSPATDNVAGSSRQQLLLVVVLLATPTPAELSISPAKGATGVLPEPSPSWSRPPPARSARSPWPTPRAVKVAGALGTDGTWTSSARLAPSAAYTVTATATGSDGTPSTTTSTFKTLKPKVTATYGILNSGETVGVGMPVSIQFDSAVATAKMRAEVEKLVTVTTSPKQAGAWGWLDNRQLMWRPANYWQPGTKVTINAPLTGVQTGVGKWVGNDDSASFTVGSSMISTRRHQAPRHDGPPRWQGHQGHPGQHGSPRPQTETRSGTKVIIRKEGT